MDNMYDILIAGGGPIGASTAYALSRQTQKKVGLVTLEPRTTEYATYARSGGSIRTYWNDASKMAMTTETTRFIKEQSDKGVDLSLHLDNYLFLNRGVYVPSININSGKLVSHLLRESAEAGVTVIYGEAITSLKVIEGGVTLETSANKYNSKKVLLALGAGNDQFMPDLNFEKEYRYLMILDLPVGENEQNFPHTVLPLPGGVAYVFIKRFEEGYRFVVGQEDVLPDPTHEDIQKHFEKLLHIGLGSAMPFLVQASVERKLEGMDVANKSLIIQNHENVLFSANCGSAVRSSIGIGNEMAKILCEE